MLGPNYEHENTLYYEKCQTTDLVFFLGSTQQIITVQKFSHACFIQILLSSKNNKNQPLKALELHLIIFSTGHAWHIFFTESTLHKKSNKLRIIFF